MVIATLALALMLATQAAPAAPRPIDPEVKGGVDLWQRGDFAAAVEKWRKPALAGDADAQFNLGQAYKLGRGVRVDLTQAEEWYRRAAQQGHRQAEDNYGLILYQNGRKREAMPLLKTSAERGEPRAQYVYGTELFNGELAPKDWPRAYAMMIAASAAGVPRASQSLAQMDGFIPAADRQRGTTMAREMERGAMRAELAAVPPAAVPPATRPMPAPAPRAAPPVRPAPGAPFAPPGAARPTPAEGPAPAAVAARPQPQRAAPAAATAPAAGGRWRVQLGAFGDPARTDALWRSLSGRVAALSGLRAMPVRAGNVVRLQAGGLPTQAAAERVCASVRAARNACVVVRP